MPNEYVTISQVISNEDIQYHTLFYIFSSYIFVPDVVFVLPAVLDHNEEGVSVFYICFSSFIAVGLFIMTAAVIRTTIRSKAKGVFHQLSVVVSNKVKLLRYCT